jgi:S-formylglutathione hydrolase FrmB
MRYSRVRSERSDRRCLPQSAAARAIMSVCATALVLPLGAGGLAAANAAPLAEAPPVASRPFAEAPLPGVRVERTDWLSDRRVALWVYSPAMGTSIQVQILLARDWHTQKQWTFPALYLLDGLRAEDHENAWTFQTDAIQFFNDKNVNVVLPVGGRGSFYSDWLEPDNGKNYQWETFLTKELPPILKGDWRVNDTAGVVGLSMGGTAAMFMAARNRGMFQFAASFSGYLSTTSYGMPRAIKAALMDAGGFNADRMWGPPENPAWDEHDPMQLARHLRGVSLYVSAATGIQGQFDQQGPVPGIPANSAGMALEMLSRVSTQNFQAKLKELNIPVTAVYRGSGTHTWPYWQQELHGAWGQIASALNVDSVGLGEAVSPPPSEDPTCEVIGAIGELAAATPDLGPCVADERTLAGKARYQEFANGTVYWSPDTGAHFVKGQILGTYQSLQGPDGTLGLPTTSETRTADGRGAFNHFEDGSIFWSPETGAQTVLEGFVEPWAATGWEAGPLGYPTGGVADSADRRGRVQPFQGGAVYWHNRTGGVAVQGEIWRHYTELGRETGVLGWPKSSEIVIGDARFADFANGKMYWSPASGSWAVLEGPIMDAWKADGYELGRLGFPTGDAFETQEGQRQNFQRGYIEVKDGKGTVVPNP